MKFIALLFYIVTLFTTTIYAYDKILITPQYTFQYQSNTVYLITNTDELKDIERAKKITDKIDKPFVLVDSIYPEAYSIVTDNKEKYYFTRYSEISKIKFLNKYLSSKNKKYLFFLKIPKKIDFENFVLKGEREGFNIILDRRQPKDKSSYRVKLISNKNFSKNFETNLFKTFPFILKIDYPQPEMTYICESDGFIPPEPKIVPPPLPEPPLPMKPSISYSIFETLPQTYSGTFQWENSKSIQKAKFVWKTKLQKSNKIFILKGDGRYRVNSKDYDFLIEGIINKSHQTIKIVEHNENNDKNLNDDGEHNGELYGNLEKIETVWIDKKTGRRGFLKLKLEKK